MNSMDFQRWIRPIKTRISFLIERAVLTLVTNEKSGTKLKTQLVQTQGMGGAENDGGSSDIERLQPYGFETYPYADNHSECVNLNIAGLRDRAINILVHNRELRPNDLAEGETCHYSKDSDGSNTNRITIRPTDEIDIKTKDNQSILINEDGIVVTDAVNGNTVTLSSTGIKMECTNGNIIEMVAGEVKINNTNLEVLI